MYSEIWLPTFRGTFCLHISTFTLRMEAYFPPERWLSILGSGKITPSSTLSDIPSQLMIVRRNFNSDSHMIGFIDGECFGSVDIGQIGLEGN